MCALLSADNTLGFNKYSSCDLFCGKVLSAQCIKKKKNPQQGNAGLRGPASPVCALEPVARRGMMGGKRSVERFCSPREG